MNHHHSHQTGDGRGRRTSLVVFVAFAAIGGYFLVTEHRAHLFSILPFLLLAACPLLHLFHHRGHGDSHDDRAQGGDGGHRH